MAINANTANRKVLQNIRTTKTDEQINAMLSATTALGEIAVKMGTGNDELEKRINTSLYTLAADGKYAVRFPSYEAVQEMIHGGASIYLDNVIDAVGLEDDGTLPSDWGTDTNYFGEDATVIDAVNSLDENLNALSGVVESFSADVKTYIDSVSGNIESTIITLSGNVKDYVDTLSGNVHSTIDAMDKAADVQTGHIVTTVSQENGLVDETKELLTNIVLSGYEKTNDTGALAAADTVEVALSKLENNIAAAKSATTVSNTDGSINVATATTGTVIDVNIKSGEHVLAKDGDAGLYTDIKLSAVTPSSTNVKEEYILKATDGTQLGKSIKIYKDSAYKEIYLGTSADTINTTTGEITKQEGDKQSLNYAYMKDDGTYDLVKVDVSAFLSESEFKSGVTATDHIVHGVVDLQSESFLTVGADGFKLSGVQDAIDAKANSLNADESGKSADDHVTVEVVEVSGKVTDVIVSTSDIASDSDLQVLSGEVISEITRAKAAETALDGVVGSTKGANDETRTYGHTGTNYLDGNTTVKADTETLDSLLGIETVADNASASTTFDSTNTVAKNITDIKLKLEEYKNNLSLTAVDDDQYIATQVTTAATGTTIGVSAITKSIASSTSGGSANESALVDSWDAKQYAITDRKASDGMNSGADSNIKTIAATNDSGKLLDFSEIVVDCGTF